MTRDHSKTKTSVYTRQRPIIFRGRKVASVDSVGTSLNFPYHQTFCEYVTDKVTRE